MSRPTSIRVIYGRRFDECESIMFHDLFLKKGDIISHIAVAIKVDTAYSGIRTTYICYCILKLVSPILKVLSEVPLIY